MKKIKFFAMILAALTIVSCSKDNHGEENKEQGKVGEPTYATFVLKSSGTSVSKSVADPTAPIVDQVADEKVVRTVRLLIFDDRGGKLLETNKLISIAHDAVKTEFIEVVKSGTKKMYMIANETAGMTAQLDALVVGSAKHDEFLKLTHNGGADADFSLADLYTIDQTANNNASHGFPMSSSDKMSYDFKAGVSKEDIENVDNTDNKFTIDLSYMLAKVKVVAKDGVLTNNSLMEFKSIKYAIANVSRETFLTQQFDGENVKGVNYTFLPNDPASSAQWADKYFSKFTRNLDIKEVADATAEPFVYVSENTKDTKSALQGGTTHASIECVVIAKDQLTGVNMGWDLVNGKINVGDVETLADAATFVVSNKAIGAIASGTAFKDLAALNKACAIVEKGADWTNETTPTTPLVEGQDYITYTNGVTYYRAHIFEMRGTAKAYGVERGKEYTITINSITNFGNPTPDPNPEIPIDQNTYIQTNISVKGWSTVNSGLDL